MKVFLSAYRILNLLSLDVVAGSISSSLFFVHLFNAPVQVSSLCVLGLSVWCIYTLDHLLDVANLSSTAFTERHRFHQHHFTLLSWGCGISLIVLIGLLPFLPREILQAGACMFIYLIIYFSLKRYGVWKELLASIGYTMGVLVPSSTYLHNLDSGKFITIIAFGITALINVILFSWFEIEADRLSKYPSITQRLGKEKTFYILVGLFFVQVTLVAILLIRTSVSVSSILAMMTTILFIVFCNPSYFIRHDRFRLVGDFVFMLPALIRVV